MDDLVERLRDRVTPSWTMDEAADRIEALEGALRTIIERSDSDDFAYSEDSWKAGYHCGWDDASAIARAALKEGMEEKDTMPMRRWDPPLKEE